MHRFTLRRVNTCLLVLIIILNLYTILLPFMPAIIFWQKQHDKAAVKELAQKVHAPVTEPVAPGERLTIPSIQLQEDIHEVKSLKSIRNDIWRRPNTSTPSRGGNTVLVGHRFTYSNPTGVLYNLDKVKIGDEIGLEWQQKRYVYRVKQIRTVEPTDSSVEAPTTDSQLTLYTCTPLWNPKQRLVVIAQLEQNV
jgi:LPXTG-site transpeptidase (sortase) family protein